eukprot:Ihof_evm3s351 gene=Ihof_evmTU3s351
MDVDGRQLQLCPEVHQQLQEAYKKHAAEANPQSNSSEASHIGSQHFDDILSALARPPLVTSVRFLSNILDASAALEKIRQAMGELGGGCTQESMKESPTLHPLLDDVLVLSRGEPRPQQLLPRRKEGCLYINTVPIPSEVVVDVRCGTAILRGANVYATKVANRSDTVRGGDMVSVMVDVHGKCKKGQKKGFIPLGLVLVGNGQAEIEIDSLFKVQSQQGIAVTVTAPIYSLPSLVDLGTMPGLDLQTIPSTVAAHVLKPLPGEAVVDMCSSPGGKTVHLAALMKDQGVVVAVDRNEAKAAKVQAKASRHGLQSVMAYAGDSTHLVDPQFSPMAYDDLRLHLANQKQMGSGPFMLPPQSFDKVLLDGPCSALGLRPRMAADLTLHNLNGYPGYQRLFFHQAMCLVKAGGILVYSTCTISPLENEGMVRWALDTYPSLQLIPQ